MFMKTDIIIITKNMNTIMIMKNMNITTIMTMSADADMTMKNMNIFTIMTMSADADMTTNMSIIMTMIMNADVDMTTTIITIIMQMKFLPAGVKRLLKNSQEKILKKSLRHFLPQKNMEPSFVPKECFRQKTEHGSTLIWFRKKQRFVKEHRNIQAVSA